MVRDSSSSPLLVPINDMNESRGEIHLEPLPPFYDQSGAFKFYMIWIWRFIIFSLTGSTSLRICNLLLERLFHLTLSSLGWISYILLVTLLELAFVYPLTLFVIGSLLGQRRFFGRVIYNGWGKRLLPRSVKAKWIQSNWL